jgi:hypothetical protein
MSWRWGWAKQQRPGGSQTWSSETTTSSRAEIPSSWDPSELCWWTSWTTRAAADARAEKQATDFAERDAQRLAELEAERSRTEKAITAFAALADRLDAMAAERSRPWWRRLAGWGAVPNGADGVPFSEAIAAEGALVFAKACETRPRGDRVEARRQLLSEREKPQLVEDN